MLYDLVNFVLRVYRLLLIVYVVLSWIRIPANQWTELVRRLVEPVLQPVRAFLRRKVPDSYWLFDWSPLALWLLIEVADILLKVLL